MKNSKTCPKCESADIIRIPGDVRAFGAGNSILVGGALLPKFVLVTRYLCGACGFSEEWIDGTDDIAKLKEVFGTGPARQISTNLYWRNLALWIFIVLVLLALFTFLQPGFR
jgi:predicted nucleic-acid-binding Zn-ribbon protein